MSEKITQRDAFFQRLYQLAKKDKDVVLVVADMAAPALDVYRRELPGQFINVGIAEQNAILIAQGLALAGKKVYVYAIAPFITLRCLEIIRVGTGIMNIPITVLGMGTGLSYMSDGPTHHLIEDLTVMRAFPNMTIYSLSDVTMAEQVATITYEHARPHYVRLDKDFYPNLYSADFDFKTHSFGVHGKGRKNLILTTGPMAHFAQDMLNTGAFAKDDTAVVDLYRLPLDPRELSPLLKGAQALVSLEEHFLPGGLGSMVAELLVDEGIPVPLKRFGLNGANGYRPSYSYGGRSLTRAAYGLDFEGTTRQVADFFGKK